MKKFKLIAVLIFFEIVSCYSQTFPLKNPGDIYISRDIFFDLDKESIRPECYIYLDSIVAFLKQNNNLTIEISVHCDERYSNIYSTCLTCNRAKSVANYIISKGIQTDRITSLGFNDTKPIIQGAKTEDEHRINRRTEFKVVRND